MAMSRVYLASVIDVALLPEVRYRGTSRLPV
ncbi:hypothetical protein EYZ11_009306 [Aspergillus tanneri]|uniref:Uncharacterized protein n=1 Tax=Aspergillus tanneri TaxID=1220188 RepID=A0A4S3J876_9EURO|nr:hypothetical protein EYZ11_009306 [Aspergillus tanneri]